MNILDSLREYLEKRYRQDLKVTLASSASDADPEVTWWQAQDGSNARLLDNELGLLLQIHVLQSGNDVRFAVQSHVQKSLEQASNLQPAYGLPDSEVDEQGPWQVSVLWLVEGNETQRLWRESIALQRAESGFSEEIALDAIFFPNPQSFKVELVKHGLPGLLFNTRALFQLRAEEMPSWLSANAKVREMLQVFPRQFQKADVRALAESMVNEVLNTRSPETTDRLPDAPSIVESLEVDHCRNLRHCRLDFTPGPTQTHIVFGPNGTGKSTLFEALSLALCGTSASHRDYLDDKDIPSTKRKDYLAHVLTPLDGGTPKIQLNGVARHPNLLDAESDEVQKCLLLSDGNFLAQETSRQFLRDTGRELGARILLGYSTLAEMAQSKANASYDQANSMRQDWLRLYDLKANITRAGTRWQRLAEHVIGQDIPPAPLSLTEWLDLAGRFFPDMKQQAASLYLRWRQLDGEARRIALTEGIATAGELGMDQVIADTLEAWLREREALTNEIRHLVENAKPAVEALRGEWDTLQQELDQWGAWLTRQTDAPGPEDRTAEHQAIAVQIESERKGYQGLLSQGQFLKLRADHLRSLQENFLRAWAKERPDECPTCGADHSKQHGIQQVVADLLKVTDEQLASLREAAKVKQALLRQLETSLAALGRCPITDERRVVLGQRLAGLTGDHPLESVLGDADARAQIKRQLETLTLLPSLQASIEDISTKASQLAQNIITLNAEGERLWQEPDRWKEIVDALKTECQRIVANHLPQTLEAVWLETALALTAAPWNLPARPRFNFKIERGNEKLTIEAGSAERSLIARYLFNQAEQHLLGLAWFFTRYFSTGRFHHALAALDDPAQEMDQTTYRAFTRYIRAFLRLHKIKSRPLALLLFLHQEERALDAARATSGSLLMLSWEKEPDSNATTTAIRRLVLLNEKFKDRLPEVVLN
ncbi:MAG: hypothetical protein A3G25_02695 [Betaproteobacteria bacterium RIFCSPLOWO2_12_FULL_63_13]|nr:MAG: hypothetical protein A3G25_02695 [Betaproteobacteria bacterium RIFCSPLOWO2_12_FULL_63_13]